MIASLDSTHVGFRMGGKSGDTQTLPAHLANYDQRQNKPQNNNPKTCN